MLNHHPTPLTSGEGGVCLPTTHNVAASAGVARSARPRPFSRLALLFSVVTGCVFGAVLVARAQIGPTSVATVQRNFEGRSGVLNFKDHLPDTTLVDSLAKLPAAEHNVREATVRAAEQISEATTAFEKERTIENEALLYETKRQATADQQEALTAYQQRLETTVRQLSRFAYELREALNDFGNQGRAASDRQHLRSSQSAQTRQQLVQIASQMAHILDENGQLPHEVEATVLTLNAIRKLWNASSADATEEIETIDTDIRQLQHLCQSLNRQVEQMQGAVKLLDAQRSLLQDAAKHQHDSMARRVLLWQSRNLLTRIADIDVREVLQRFPTEDSPRERHVVRFKVPTSDDIPSEPVIPERAANGRRNRLGVGVRNSSNHQGVVVTHHVDGSPATRCLDQYGRPWYLDQGEVVTKINTRQIRDAQDFIQAMDTPDREMRLTVVSEGRTYDLLAVLNGITHHDTRLGAYVQSVGSNRGVRVTGAVEGSPATRCIDHHGREWILDPGETITHVNGRLVHNEGCFRRAILISSRDISLTVKCVHGNTHHLSARLNY